MMGAPCFTPPPDPAGDDLFEPRCPVSVPADTRYPWCVRCGREYQLREVPVAAPR